MSEIFGPDYAAAYDALYGDKDYSAECRLILRLFAEFAAEPVTRIVDLGCGSGNHLLPLAASGLRGVGVDRSPSMLAHANRKAADAGLSDRLRFVCGDIQACDLGERFDAALMMFAVLGYQTENAGVLAALRNARRHLRPGGLLLLDCWYGPAVLSQLPSDRVKTVETASGRLTRFASSTLDPLRHTCSVTFHVQPADFQESHTVRFFFPKEIELFLDLAGFRLLRLGRFPETALDPDHTTWNVVVVAVAQ